MSSDERGVGVGVVVVVVAEVMVVGDWLHVGKCMCRLGEARGQERQKALVEAKHSTRMKIEHPNAGPTNKRSGYVHVVCAARIHGWSTIIEAERKEGARRRRQKEGAQTRWVMMLVEGLVGGVHTP